jgi:hypothetical protein
MSVPVKRFDIPSSYSGTLDFKYRSGEDYLERDFSWLISATTDKNRYITSNYTTTASFVIPPQSLVIDNRITWKFLSFVTQYRGARWMLRDISEAYITSIIKVERWTKRNISKKQADTISLRSWDWKPLILRNVVWFSPHYLRPNTSSLDTT